MRTLFFVALALLASSCVSSSDRIYAAQKFTAAQVYARRLEFAQKTVRAEFVWHFGFEKCDAWVPAEGGGYRFLRIDVDDRAVRAASPSAWKVVRRMRREFGASILEAVRDRTKSPKLTEFTMIVDADVKVILSDYEFRKDVIVIGNDLTLKVVAIHSIREEGANQAPEPTTLLVMSRAYARATPSRVVAHL